MTSVIRALVIHTMITSAIIEADIICKEYQIIWLLEPLTCWNVRAFTQIQEYKHLPVFDSCCLESRSCDFGGIVLFSHVSSSDRCAHFFQQVVKLLLFMHLTRTPWTTTISLSIATSQDITTCLQYAAPLTQEEQLIDVCTWHATV